MVDTGADGDSQSPVVTSTLESLWYKLGNGPEPMDIEALAEVTGSPIQQDDSVEFSKKSFDFPSPSPLPLKVQVIDGYSGGCENDFPLVSGTSMWILGRSSEERVEIRDSSGAEVQDNACFSQRRFRILPGDPSHDDKQFVTLQEAIENIQPLPRYLLAKAGYVSRNGDCIDAEDVVEVLNSGLTTLNSEDEECLQLQPAVSWPKASAVEEAPLIVPVRASLAVSTMVDGQGFYLADVLQLCRDGELDLPLRVRMLNADGEVQARADQNFTVCRLKAVRSLLMSAKHQLFKVPTTLDQVAVAVPDSESQQECNDTDDLRKTLLQTISYLDLADLPSVCQTGVRIRAAGVYQHRNTPRATMSTSPSPTSRLCDEVNPRPSLPTPTKVLPLAGGVVPRSKSPHGVTHADRTSGIRYARIAPRKPTRPSSMLDQRECYHSGMPSPGTARDQRECYHSGMPSPGTARYRSESNPEPPTLPPRLASGGVDLAATAFLNPAAAAGTEAVADKNVNRPPALPPQDDDDAEHRPQAATIAHQLQTDETSESDSAGDSSAEESGEGLYEPLQSSPSVFSHLSSFSTQPNQPQLQKGNAAGRSAMLDSDASRPSTPGPSDGVEDDDSTDSTYEDLAQYRKRMLPVTANGCGETDDDYVTMQSATNPLQGDLTRAQKKIKKLQKKIQGKDEQIAKLNREREFLTKVCQAHSSQELAKSNTANAVASPATSRRKNKKKHPLERNSSDPAVSIRPNFPMFLKTRHKTSHQLDTVPGAVTATAYSPLVEKDWPPVQIVETMNTDSEDEVPC